MRPRYGGIGAYRPVDHLTGVHRKRPDDTDNPITEDGSRERREYCRGRINFRVIEELGVGRYIVNHRTCELETTLTRCTAKLRTAVLP